MATPTKIAILLNGYDSSYKPPIRKSFETAITAAAAPNPSPTIDFFDPIVAQSYPDPTKYELIVLSGGTEDPMGSNPWVLKMQDFLRSTVSNHPKQKILGICWGHQTICVTFGGNLEGMDAAELGVTNIKLTSEGRRFFPFTGERPLKMHEFHKRDIKVPALGFIKLAEGNQSFINEANTILTFQGHPELNSELAGIMLGVAPSYMGVEGERKEALFGSLGAAHDGVEIWRRILTWINE